MINQFGYVWVFFLIFSVFLQEIYKMINFWVLFLQEKLVGKAVFSQFLETQRCKNFSDIWTKSTSSPKSDAMFVFHGFFPLKKRKKKYPLLDFYPSGPSRISWRTDSITSYLKTASSAPRVLSQELEKNVWISRHNHPIGPLMYIYPSMMSTTRLI